MTLGFEGKASRLAGHVVVEELVSYGIDMAFAVPGESYLSVLDGLYEYADQIRLITARQEGGASMMAAAYGRATGKPGVCLVTRGPGATNASIGVHVARQDASPMLLLVGQVPERNRERIAFQEVDYVAMFGTVAKAVIELGSPDRVPEMMSRAIQLSVSGEPGPVVVVLPENVVNASTDAQPVKSVPLSRPIPNSEIVKKIIQEIEASNHPVIIAGRCNWSESVRDKLAAFAERNQIPVVTAVRCQDVIDNRSEYYVGTLGLNTTPNLPSMLEDADLVVFLGTRPDALTMGDFSFMTPPRPSARVIHVYPDPDSIGRVYAVDIAVPVSPEEFLDSVSSRLKSSQSRQDWIGRLRQNDVDREAIEARHDISKEFMERFNSVMPVDTITTAGAGNYTGWVQRHRRFSAYPSQVGTQSGAMGYGIPAGIAASLLFPERTVVSFAGDGCFMMNGQELATASMERLNLMVVVVNNSKYGTIRDHQEREFPKRVVGTSLENPDFVKLAEAYGGEGTKVSSPQEFEDALLRYKDLHGLRLIEVSVE